jgi:hypothetical protein
MNTAPAAAEQHVHVDLDLDPEHKFHYRSQGRDGHRVVLHHGDSVTFTGSGEFSIWFPDRSPFEAAGLHSRHSFITARVRANASCGAYAYTVEVMEGDRLFTDPQFGQDSRTRPEIIIEG